jgi:PAS domain S-box-containing protein
VTTDRDGCVTEMNSVAEQLTGWSREEADGKLLDDILALHSARTGETVESPADEVLREGATVGLANHTVLTARDGTEYQIADSAAPIRSGEGDLLGVVLVFRDVTEKYEQRRRIERQNDLFAKAQDLASVGAWEYDVQSGESIWTEEVYRIHGLPPGVETGPEQSLQFYHEKDRPVIEEAFALAVEEGEPYDLELRLIPSDGDERWVRTRGEPQTEDGEVVRVRGTIQDITERKNREIRLEEMRDRMELALDHTSSVVFEIDLEADHVSRVGAYEKFFGMPSEEVDTREQHENRAVHPDDRADFRAFYRELARGERTSGTLEYRTNPEFGDVRWIRDNVHRIEGTDRLLGLARDITVRKEQRERLRLLAEATEQVGDKVVITDREGRIEFVNEAFEQITGFDGEEVLGSTPTVLQSGAHGEAHYREL